VYAIATELSILYSCLLLLDAIIKVIKEVIIPITRDLVITGDALFNTAMVTLFNLNTISVIRYSVVIVYLNVAYLERIKRKWIVDF